MCTWLNQRITARLQHRFLQVASVITDAQGVGTWFVQATLAANQTVTATAADPVNGLIAA